MADRSRPGDRPGSWRGDGGRYLSPEQNAAADRLIGELRQPEPAITARLQRIEQESPFGGYLAGLDCRLKGDQRLKEKLADGLENEFGSRLTDVAGEISDAIRYTFCFSRDQYVVGLLDIRQRLESDGCQETYSKNHWCDDPQYKGINTRWERSDGSRFELQFHTAESLHAKEHLTHRSYERVRSLDEQRSERRELEHYQELVGAVIPEPFGVAGIVTRPGKDLV